MIAGVRGAEMSLIADERRGARTVAGSLDRPVCEKRENRNTARRTRRAQLHLVQLKQDPRTAARIGLRLDVHTGLYPPQIGSARDALFDRSIGRFRRTARDAQSPPRRIDRDDLTGEPDVIPSFARTRRCGNERKTGEAGQHAYRRFDRDGSPRIKVHAARIRVRRTPSPFADKQPPRSADQTGFGADCERLEIVTAAIPAAIKHPIAATIMTA